MKTVTLPFTVGHRNYVVTANYTHDSELLIKTIRFRPFIQQIDFKDLERLKTDIKKAVFVDVEDTKVSVPVIPVVVSTDNKPALKVTLRSALAHVFGGKEGTLFSRLDDIRKMAESEMNDEEKKAAAGLMDNLKKLAGK